MKKIIDIKNLGINVRRYREEKGLSASKLADITGVSVSHINNIESASSHASADVLVRIASALDVPLDLLLCDSLTGEANRMARVMEYYKLMEDCSESEMKIILATLEVLKRELKNQNEK